MRETASYPSGTGGLPDAELVSIAVSGDARERGVGRALAEGVVQGLAERGASQVKVIVEAGNESANVFYQALGFRHASRIQVHRGVTSNVWVISCPSSRPSRSPSS